MKKVTAICCAVILLLSTAACAPVSTKAPDNASQASNQAETTSVVDWHCPYMGEPVTFTFFAMDFGANNDDDNQVNVIYQNAIGNIEINWDLAPAWADYDMKLNLYLASGDLPDMMWARDSVITGDYATSGMFLDINNYKEYAPNYYNAIATEYSNFLNYQTTDGQMIFMSGLSYNGVSNVNFANKTLLDELGLTVPTNLEEMEAAMAVIVEKAPDVTPMLFRFGGLGPAFGYVNSTLRASRGFYCDDGTWKYDIYDDPASRYIDSIRKITEWYENGYLNQEFATISDDQIKEVFQSNKWAFAYDYAIGIHQNYDLYAYNDEFPIDIVPMYPIVEKGLKPFIEAAYQNDNPAWPVIINAKTKYPELCISYVDTLCGEICVTANIWGVEGVSYTKDANGKKMWIPSFLDQGAEAANNLGIGKTLGPNLRTKLDPSAEYNKLPRVCREAVAFNAELLNKGEAESLYRRQTPMFTEEENDERSSIMGFVNTIRNENEMKFIYGQRPLEELDDYIEEVKAAGDILRVLEIYQNADQYSDRLQTKDRIYAMP